MNRVDRLMNILLTLQSQKFVTIEAITKKHKLSERTIYRDLKALNEIGVPVYFEPQKGHARKARDCHCHDWRVCYCS